MAKFSIDMNGVGDIQSKIKGLVNYRPVIRSCIVKSLADMKNRSNIITPKVSGELRISAYQRMNGDLEGIFGFSKEYAPYVEYGHRIVRGGRQIGFKKANPFLKPNAEAQAKILKKDCEEAIRRLVK